MRSVARLAVALVAILFIAVPLSAEDKQPAAVISIASHDTLVAAGGELAKITGMPLEKSPEQVADEMLKQLTGGKGFPKLDKTKPMGAVLPAGKTDLVLFAPLGDLESVLDSLPEKVEREAGEDGTTRLTVPDQPPFNVKGVGTWVFAAPSAGPLADVPADPSKLLGDLPRKYLMAARVKVPNLAAEQRDEWLQGLPVPEEAQEKLKSLAGQLDELTIGWKVDAAEKQIVAEVITTAVAGSELAGWAPRMADRSTKYAGLRSPEAAVSIAVSAAGELTPTERSDLKKGREDAEKRMEEKVDEDESIPDASKAAAKEAYSALLKVLFDTAETGVRDGGVALFTQPKLTLVAGGQVSDGEAMAKALKRLGGLVEGDPSVPEIKWDAGEHGGYKLHSMKWKPAGKLAAVAGETVEISVAVGKESVLAAAGSEPLPVLKKVIDASAAEKKVPAVELIVRARPLLEMFAKLQPDNPLPQLFVAQLAALKPGADELVVRSVPVERGVMFRVAIREGAIKALAFSSILYQQQQIGPPPGAFEFEPADKSENEPADK